MNYLTTKDFDTRQQKVLQLDNYFILEFLFFFEHPFLYLLFLRIVDNSKNIRMNYLTTKGFCNSIIQRFLQLYYPKVFATL
jgi:hypothetical protein